MTEAHVVILLATGIGAGFASGLLGIGGCFIMTPVQYMVFTALGLPADMAIKLAFGTCLLVALPTALSGAWRHSRQGAVWWKAVFVMGSCTMIAAFAGATLATRLPGDVLKLAFGAAIILSIARMLTVGQPAAQREPEEKRWLWVAWGIPVGFVSGILGVGGGIFTVPVMAAVLRLRMHNAVATSLAVMIFTTLGGAAGYIVNGLGVPNLPGCSIGYVYLPAWLILAITSVGMAPVGAIAAHRLPARYLKYVFVAVMFYMGLKMLGVFDWLGLPA